MSAIPVVHLRKVDSTNAEAMRRIAEGERGPLWIMAETQTTGRGRAGRVWVSEAGNFHASLLTTIPAPALHAYQLALVTGVAAFDALNGDGAFASDGLSLKWPNDILIAGAKAGGILIESSMTADGLAAVIGIGLNVASAPPIPDRPVTCLAAHLARDGPPTPRLILERLSASMAEWLAVWDHGRGFAAVREAWLRRAHPIGERMSINTGTERVCGAFLGLDSHGALMLDNESGVRRFTFGDVSLGR